MNETGKTTSEKLNIIDKVILLIFMTVMLITMFYYQKKPIMKNRLQLWKLKIWILIYMILEQLSSIDWRGSFWDNSFPYPYSVENRRFGDTIGDLTVTINANDSNSNTVGSGTVVFKMEPVIYPHPRPYPSPFDF